MPYKQQIHLNKYSQIYDLSNVSINYSHDFVCPVFEKEGYQCNFSNYKCISILNLILIQFYVNYKEKARLTECSVLFLQDTNRMMEFAVEIHIHCAPATGNVYQTISFPLPLFTGMRCWVNNFCGCQFQDHYQINKTRWTNVSN